MVGLKAHCFVFPLGTADLVDSFFYTVSWRLEQKRWGNRFPAIMNELYQGLLPYESLEEADFELRMIKDEMSYLPHTSGIWVYELRSDPPPREIGENKNAEDLSETFMTNIGRNMLDEFKTAIRVAKRYKEPVKMESIQDPIIVKVRYKEYDESAERAWIKKKK